MRFADSFHQFNAFDREPGRRPSLSLDSDVRVSSTSTETEDHKVLIQSMNATECREFLARMDVGRLGCVRDGMPYVVPIHFAFESDRLYGFSTVGQKIEWMRANPKVCVEVDEIMGTRRWCSVVVNGHYKELPNEVALMSERQRAYGLLEKRFLWWETAFAAEQPRHATHPAESILYSIQVTEMTGRRASSDDFDAAPAQQSDAY